MIRTNQVSLDCRWNFSLQMNKALGFGAPSPVTAKLPLGMYAGFCRKHRMNVDEVGALCERAGHALKCCTGEGSEMLARGWCYNLDTCCADWVILSSLSPGTSKRQQPAFEALRCTAAIRDPFESCRSLLAPLHHGQPNELYRFSSLGLRQSSPTQLLHGRSTP